jgi:hypothetical protein
MHASRNKIVSEQKGENPWNQPSFRRMNAIANHRLWRSVLCLEFRLQAVKNRVNAELQAQIRTLPVLVHSGFSATACAMMEVRDIESAH